MTGSLDAVRRELETNMFGRLAMVREFAPALAGNGGGAGAYHLTKAAAWAMTNGVRLERADQWSRDVKSRLPLAPEEFHAAMERAMAALMAA